MIPSYTTLVSNEGGHTPCDHIISYLLNLLYVAMKFYRSVQVNMQTVSRFSWSCPSCSLDRCGWFEFCNLPSGYFSRSYREDPPLLMGKSTISMAIFNSYVTNYQRVCELRFGKYSSTWPHKYSGPQVAQALRVLHLPDPPVPHAAGNMLERDWLKPLYVDVENDYNII